MAPMTPNQSLQRTAPGVTACAPTYRPAPAAFPHRLRRPPQSLSLGSLGDSAPHPSKTMKTPITTILTALVAITFGAAHTHAVDTTLSITPIANSSYVGILPGFPQGTAILGGVTFDLPASRPDWQSNPNSQAPDLSATLSLSIDFASSVRLLLNTGNTYTSQMQIGDQIGSIVLGYTSGPTDTVLLRVGNNIREQAVGTTAQPVINTFTDSNLQEVWRGNNNGGVESVVDMLTIPLSGTRTLTSIQFIDQSQANIGQVNPVLALKGATVQSVPEPASALLLVFGGALCLRRRTLRTHERSA